jgi:hypothetical protein
VSLKFAFDIQLEATAGVRGGREAKIGIERTAVGSDNADEGDVVRVIEDVENVQRGRKNGPALLFFLEMKIVGNV